MNVTRPNATLAVKDAGVLPCMWGATLHVRLLTPSLLLSADPHHTVFGRVDKYGSFCVGVSQEGLSEQGSRL